MPTMTKAPQFLRVESPTRGVSAVDREKRMISGVVLAEEGMFKTKGRGQFISESLAALVDLGGLSERGVKSRLTHPSLSEDGVATNLGRIRNLRQEGPKAIGDLFFNRSSSVSPDGDLANFVMTFAEDDPDAFGMSVVIQTDLFHPETMEQLSDEAEDELRAEGLTPVWIPTQLHAVDVVDEGDATNSFLSAGGDLSDSVVRHGTAMLDKLFAEASRDVIHSRCTAWIDRYLTNRFGEKPMPTVIDKPKEEVLEKPVEDKQPVEQVDEESPDKLAVKPDEVLDGGQRAIEICEITQMAGCPELAAGFIKDEKLSATDVRNHLLQRLTKQLALSPDNETSEPESDPYKLWRQDYDKNRAAFERKGITIEKYIENRKSYDTIPA